MTAPAIINEQAFTGISHEHFAEARPFPYTCIENFLDEEFAKNLVTHFPPINEMAVKYDGMNEKKAEDASFSKLDPAFTALKNRLMQPDILQAVEQLTGISGLCTIDDRYGCGLHQGGKGSFLDIHVDYNIHPLAKKQRRLNMILFLNPGWEEAWGGQLELWNSSVSACETKLLPVFNRCVIFECSNISYHGYNTIHCPENETRKSFYLYFFSPIQEKMVFHDTIFKPLPEHSASKRILTKTKEFIKNTVKQVLYYSGLNKLLK